MTIKERLVNLEGSLQFLQTEILKVQGAIELAHALIAEETAANAPANAPAEVPVCVGAPEEKMEKVPAGKNGKGRRS